MCALVRTAPDAEIDNRSPGSRVSVQKMSDENTWRLGIESTEALATLTLVNAVDVAVPGQLIEAEFGRGRPMTLKSRTETGRLEFAILPSDPASFLVRNNIRVTEVGFEEPLDEASPDNIGVTRGRISSVIKGKRSADQSLGGRQVTLRTREMVELDGVESACWARDRFQLADGLHLNVSSSARRLRVGPVGEFRRR